MIRSGRMTDDKDLVMTFAVAAMQGLLSSHQRDIHSMGKQDLRNLYTLIGAHSFGLAEVMAAEARKRFAPRDSDKADAALASALRASESLGQ
jgi:hypothetical protein